MVYPRRIFHQSIQNPIARLDRMCDYKPTSMIITPIMGVLLAIGVCQSAAQNSTSNEKPIAVASSSTYSASPPQKEGCKLGKYKGTVPLNQVEGYFPGEEDLRGGMICTFRIDPDLALFTFHFAGQEDNSFGDLDVIESNTGDVVQTIEGTIGPSDIPMGTAANSVLNAVDANFDGYKDLQILSNCGATGNCSYDFYIYDPKKEEFLRNDFLSDLGTPSFDAKKKQVTSSSNGSASDWQNETYQYENGGRYTLIHREVSTWDRNNDTVTVSTYELRNGQMELVDSTTTPQ
ncbi:MAG: hypothetical protein WAM04_20585 [Candidatus Sulfotelmatobacter sp.]